MSNVVEMGINTPTPKQEKHTYRDYKIILTFIPGKQAWGWKVEETRIIRYTGECETHGDAIRKAKRTVDSLIEAKYE